MNRWDSYVLATHQLLEKEGVKHVFDNNAGAPRSWNKQWMAPILAELMGLTRQPVDHDPKRESTGARDGVPTTHHP